MATGAPLARSLGCEGRIAVDGIASIRSYAYLARPRLRRTCAWAAAAAERCRLVSKVRLPGRKIRRGVPRARRLLLRAPTNNPCQSPPPAIQKTTTTTPPHSSGRTSANCSSVPVSKYSRTRSSWHTSLVATAASITSTSTIRRGTERYQQ